MTNSVEERDLPVGGSLGDKLHSMLNQVQQKMADGFNEKRPDAETREAVAEILEAQSVALKKEAVQLRSGKYIMSDRKYRVVRVGAEGDSAEARWSGTVYIDEKDRCWVPVGESGKGEIVVSLVSFRAGTILGLLKEI